MAENERVSEPSAATGAGSMSPAPSAGSSAAGGTASGTAAPVTSAPGTVTATADGPPVPPKRSPGHRGADVKDTVAEMAAKAHEISLEAGSRMAAAMKDVVNAAAGLTGFVMESARDLVQFMVRRGQMTQEEADKLIRQVEEHQPKRKTPPAPPAGKAGEAAPKATRSFDMQAKSMTFADGGKAASNGAVKPTSAPAPRAAVTTPVRHAATVAPKPASVSSRPSAVPAVKRAAVPAKAAPRAAVKSATKTAAKKPVGKAAKPAVKTAARSPAKSAGKTAAKSATKKSAPKKAAATKSSKARRR